MKTRNIFTVIVVGDNPENIISKYDANNQVPKYTKYKYLDANKLHKNEIKLLEAIAKKNKADEFSEIRKHIESIQSLSDFDYYKFLTQGMEYDEDGNALSVDNPNAQFKYHKIASYFGTPFNLLDGTTSFQSVIEDIDWDKMHLNFDNVNMYTKIWDMVKNDVKPSTDIEQTLFDNMKSHINYFDNFSNVDEYVIHNCSFWHYAFCDKDKWIDLDNDNISDKEWVKNYYERFIKPLDKKSLLTIFECRR